MSGSPDAGARIRRVAMGAVLAALLLLPLAAMQITDEVYWTASDFLFAAVVLGGGGILYEMTAPRLRHRRERLVLAAAIIAAILLVWAQGAVGIFN